MKRSHANRKATKKEMARATDVIQEAYPDYDVVWGSHGDFGGHRAPRDHTLAFRLRDRLGRYRSNVIWVAPDSLSSITVEWVKKTVTIKAKNRFMSLLIHDRRGMVLAAASSHCRPNDSPNRLP
jgi:hypothetical protein